LLIQYDDANQYNILTDGSSYLPYWTNTSNSI